MRTLHHWRLDPFGRAVRAALAEKKLEFAEQDETPWAPGEALRKADPLGAWPVLIEDGAAAAVGARAILEYLEEAAPDPALLEGTPAERAEMRRLIDWFERRFEPEASLPIRTERLVKRLTGGGAPDMESLRTAREAARWHLDYVDYLAGNRDWLGGRRMSAADLTVAAHLSALDYLGEIPWDDFAAAKDWYARIKSRPCFRAILADRIAGAPPPPHYADLDF